MAPRRKDSFFEDVFEIVRLVPEGRVTTYGAIARYLGAARSSRMVGYAMNLSHFEPLPVPAHRVVNRRGMLTGKAHFAYPEQMAELLEAEGIKVRDDVILEFENHLWDPNLELNM